MPYDAALMRKSRRHLVSVWLSIALLGCSGKEAESPPAPGSSSTAGAGGIGGTMASTTGAGGAGGAGTGGAMPCNETLVGGPQATPYSFMLGGQLAWSHDDGDPAGYFHTYDALDVGGGMPHKVHVLVPRSYGACDAGYPVVYLNDGGGVFWNNEFGKSWRVQDALQALYEEGSIPKMIAVAIEPNDRNAEYSHVQVGPGQTCCEVDAYASYVADHVKAFVDTHYRTAKGRESTFILGSSRGGLACFYLATRRPSVFGKAICMSSSFWAGLDPVFGGNYPGGALATSSLITPITDLLSNPQERPHFWIDWGLLRTGGFHNEVIEEAATVRGKEMVGLLEGTYGYIEGKELFWMEDSLGEHDETSWGRRLPNALRALWKP